MAVFLMMILKTEGYIVNRKDRNRFGGGVAIYIHTAIQFTLREDLKDLDLETLTVELNLPFIKPIVLTTLYRPEGPVEVFNRIESMVSNIVGNNKEFILMGDLNCDLLSGTATRTKHLVQIYNTYGLQQIIKEATRTTSNTQTLIDHIVTNKPDKVADSGVIPCDISDHGLIYIIRHAKLLKIKRKPRISTIRIHKNLTESSLLDDLNGIPFDLISDTSDNTNGLWLTWKTFFMNIFNKHAPIKTIRGRGNNLPYVTAEVKSLIRQRDYLRGKANQTGIKYLRQAYQQLRNKVDYTLRKLKSDYYTKKIEESKGILGEFLKM